MGMEMSLQAKIPAIQMKQMEAHAKARRLVALSQGNAALEAQAVGERTKQQLIEQTAAHLLAHPKRLLWSR